MASECEKIHHEKYKEWCKEGKFLRNEEGAVVHALSSLRGDILDHTYQLRRGNDIERHTKELVVTQEDMKIILEMIDEVIFINWLEENKDNGKEKWEKFKQDYLSGNEE